jgi:serine/threonine-protein kinase
MERLPGRTLGDEIAAGPMPQRRVRMMLHDVLGALATAHRAGIVHRDIKPGNVLLTDNGGAMKVADFGIAKSAGAALTATGQIVGTAAYMSPERVAGAPASVADDLYAVGIMAHEALTGRRPYPQENPASLIRAVLEGPPPPIETLRPDVDPALAAVINASTSPASDGRRFRSAEEMCDALSGTPPPSRPATKVLEQPLALAPSANYYVPPQARRKPMSRNRKLLLAAAAFVAFTVATLAFALDPSSSTQPSQPVVSSTAAPPPPPSPTVAPPPSPEPVTLQPQPPPGKKGPGGNGRGNGNKKHDD